MDKVTAQVSDSVCYQGKWYALAARRGGPLFHPSQYDLRHYDMRVSKITTACWRGYVCSYEVDDDRLELVSVDLGLSDPPIELFGAPVSQGPFGSARYEPIRVPQPFDGGLLIASELLPDLYAHMGFHPAWKYKHVFELIFDDGHLTEARDRSLDAAARRAAEGVPLPRRPWWRRWRSDDPRRLGDQVDPSFDRDYWMPLPPHRSRDSLEGADDPASDPAAIEAAGCRDERGTPSDGQLF